MRPCQCPAHSLSGICCPLGGAWRHPGLFCFYRAWRRVNGASTRSATEIVDRQSVCRETIALKSRDNLSFRVLGDRWPDRRLLSPLEPAAPSETFRLLQMRDDLEYSNLNCSP